ncbi:MAG: hydrogenase/urease maturation nickel metallochaperone HypA [Patescibacteria group bacterium]
MHDFHLADQIFKTILDHAAKNNLKKITKISISLGSLVEHGEEILAENLEFNIKMLAQNGLAQGLEVKIKKIPGNSWILEKIQGE